MNRYGIHAAKKSWTVAPLAVKPKLAEAMLAEEATLQAHYLGRLVLDHCRLNDFKRSRKQWLHAAEGAERKRKVFADLLDDTPAAPTQAQPAAAAAAVSNSSRKGKHAEDEDADEIDQLFSGASSAAPAEKRSKKEHKKKSDKERPEATDATPKVPIMERRRLSIF